MKIKHFLFFVGVSIAAYVGVQVVEKLNSQVVVEEYQSEGNRIIRETRWQCARKVIFCQQVVPEEGSTLWKKTALEEVRVGDFCVECTPHGTEIYQVVP